MNLSKAELRKQLKLKRQQVSKAEAERLSLEIVKNCLSLIPWQSIQSLHTYVPVLAENEVSAWHLLEYAWQNYPAVQTVVPRLNQRGKYDSVVVTAETKWQTTGLRIPEPKNGKVLAASQKFDVIIVPMLGFDEGGYRLGHGLGWYDRFLATQPQALTIGLCYETGRVPDGLPHEPHDIPLQMIVTEHGQVHLVQ